MAENVFREEISDDDPRLRWSKVVKKIADALNKVTFLKEDYGDRPLMAPKDWEPARTEGLGNLLDVDKIAKHLDLSARGFSAFKDKQPGMGDRIPELRSDRKDAIAAIGDWLPGPGPTEAKLAAGAAAGVIRRKGDNVTPQVAQEVVDALMKHNKPLAYSDDTLEVIRHASNPGPMVGPPAPYQDPAIYDEITQKLARYIQKQAGTEGDPMQGLNLWAKPDSSWVDTSGMPMEPNTDIASALSNSGLRGALVGMDSPRADLPSPTGTAGASADEIAATMLAPGVKARQNLDLIQAVEGIPEDTLKGLDRFYTENMGAYSGRGVARELRRTKDDALQTLSESGVLPEKLDEVLATMPPGTGLGTAQKFKDGDTSYPATALSNMAADPGFADAWARIPANKRQQMSFPQIYSKVDENLTKALREYDMSVRGEIVHKYPDGDTWQKLDQKELLKREGAKQNICVGGDDYCERVARGNMEIFSLRDQYNKPGVTLSLNVRGGPKTEFKLPERWSDMGELEMDWSRIIEARKPEMTADQIEAMRDSFYNMGLSNSRIKRLMRYEGYDLPTVDDYRELFYALDTARGYAADPYDPRQAGKAKGLLDFLQIPGETIDQPKTYTLDQIKGKNNRYAKDWSAEEKDRWFPKVKELIEKSNVQGEDGDLRGFNDAYRKWNAAKQAKQPAPETNAWGVYRMIDEQNQVDVPAYDDGEYVFFLEGEGDNQLVIARRLDDGTIDWAGAQYADDARRGYPRARIDEIRQLLQDNWNLDGNAPVNFEPQ